MHFYCGGWNEIQGEWLLLIFYYAFLHGDKTTYKQRLIGLFDILIRVYIYIYLNNLNTCITVTKPNTNVLKIHTIVVEGLRFNIWEMSRAFYRHLRSAPLWALWNILGVKLFSHCYWFIKSSRLQYFYALRKSCQDVPVCIMCIYLFIKTRINWWIIWYGT